MIVEKKNSNIYITVTTTDEKKSIANFKIRLPWDWCVKLGLSEEEKQICISYEGSELVIEKAYERYFTSLNKHEKILQLKKYEKLYGHEYDVKKDLIKSMEEYFNVSYRTIYRLLKENANVDEIERVELIKRQVLNDNRNINLMTSEYKGSKITSLTIPTNLAIQFLTKKTYDELNIKNATDLYPENVNSPISIRLMDGKIYIGEYDESIEMNKSALKKSDKNKDELMFKKLSTYEKTIQINKFVKIYGNDFNNKTALINGIKDYFKIKSTPTVYKYLKEDIKSEDLKNVKLLEKQT